ncbi:hypothetical protein FRB94_001020 [Tulasnella sp. JGI-2019a]|nr:hypothetical protein FRB94_001020 [Tulasnella sp. JGI-2019a]KAG9016884.1 hypothetical protein FRB93_009414 [Tulasnella sp. JGI-2019a]
MEENAPDILGRTDIHLNEPGQLEETSPSTRQIRALGDVDVQIVNLLRLAASSMRLLALPDLEPDHPPAINGEAQTSNDGDITSQDLPKEATATGEERSELFVDRANLYFHSLENIQHALRKALYDMRQIKISPSSIIAPQPDFVPPALGLGPPRHGAATASSSERETDRQGLQETRAEKVAWLGIVAALERLKTLRTEPGRAPTESGTPQGSEDSDPSSVAESS